VAAWEEGAGPPWPSRLVVCGALPGASRVVGMFSPVVT
jgi:hypothetical protein